VSRSGYVNTDNTRGRLYATVGLPHSGKSTFANRWAREGRAIALFDSEVAAISEVVRPRVVIAGDDFRRAIHGTDYIARAEHIVFSAMDTAVAALLERGYDVLVDETSTSKATLMRYLRLDPDVDLVFVDTPADECKRRALANGRPYLVKVIDRLAPRLDNLRENWGTIRTDLLSQVEHLVLRD
jgi:predicted kinase